MGFSYFQELNKACLGDSLLDGLHVGDLVSVQKFLHVILSFLSFITAV